LYSPDGGGLDVSRILTGILKRIGRLKDVQFVG
jgi:hypothetical protein